MPMQVMRIRHMRVGMGLRFMLMPVAVCPFGLGAVCVVMVTVGVVVRMFVVQRGMLMGMAMRLHQVQQDAAQHEQATGADPQADRAVAHGQRQHRANKRCKREHRPGAGGAKGALRQQVKAQAQTVASGAHGQQACHSAPARRGL